MIGLQRWPLPYRGTSWFSTAPGANDRDRERCCCLGERRPIQAIDDGQATSGYRKIGIPSRNKSESVDHLIRLPLRSDIQHLDPMLNRANIWIAAMGAS